MQVGVMRQATTARPYTRSRGGIRLVCFYVLLLRNNDPSDTPFKLDREAGTDSTVE